MDKIYHMCKPQLAQIDCRLSHCKYHHLGACTNSQPAITLKQGGRFNCWSFELKEGEIVLRAENFLRSTLRNNAFYLVGVVSGKYPTTLLRPIDDKRPVRFCDLRALALSSFLRNVLITVTGRDMRGNCPTAITTILLQNNPAVLAPFRPVENYPDTTPVNITAAALDFNEPAAFGEVVIFSLIPE